MHYRSRTAGAEAANGVTDVSVRSHWFSFQVSVSQCWTVCLAKCVCDAGRDFVPLEKNESHIRTRPTGHTGHTDTGHTGPFAPTGIVIRWKRLAKQPSAGFHQRNQRSLFVLSSLFSLSHNVQIHFLGHDLT